MDHPVNTPSNNAMPLARSVKPEKMANKFGAPKNCGKDWNEDERIRPATFSGWMICEIPAVIKIPLKHTRKMRTDTPFTSIDLFIL